MQIFIKCMTGKTVTIDASAGDTILLIKYKFQDKEGIAPAQVCLLFGGRELEDDKTLAHYSIAKETTLSMIERVLAPAASPLQSVANAASTGEVVAALTVIASSVAAVPPTITLAKLDLIAGIQAWRKEHTDQWAEDAALIFGKALAAFGERTDVHAAAAPPVATAQTPDAAEPRSATCRRELSNLCNCLFKCL